MWHFLAYEANWTEIVTNTLALGFGFMTIAVIIHAAIFNDDPDMLRTTASVTSGITGAIVGYYFNRSRLRAAQDRADTAIQERDEASEVVQDTGTEFLELKARYDTLLREYQSLADDTAADEDEDDA